MSHIVQAIFYMLLVNYLAFLTIFSFFLLAIASLSIFKIFLHKFIKRRHFIITITLTRGWAFVTSCHKAHMWRVWWWVLAASPLVMVFFFTWIIPRSYWGEGLVLACLLLCLGCGLVWTNFHKVPQLAASIASSLSLLISLIGENEILNLDGHILDIEPLDHLLHLVD